MRSFRSDQRGASSVEYLIVICVIAVAGIGGWHAFGGTLDDALGRNRDSIVRMQVVPSVAAPIAPPAAAPAAESLTGSTAGEPELVVTALPSTGAGPDPAGAIAAQRPMTVPEAALALEGFDELPASDPVVQELEGQLGPVLTNPVFVFRDDRGRTSYFGYVDEHWIQIDFDREGNLTNVIALDDYSAAVWLCEAGSAQACAAKQAMDDRSRAEMDGAAGILALAVSVTPAGVVLDVVDVVTSCPSSPTSFDCGAAALGIIPGVPGVGRLDEVVDAARTARRIVRGRPATVDPADLPTDVRVRDEQHFLDLGYDPATDTFRAAEARTGARIEAQEGITLTRAPRESGADWIGSDGREYDAFGGTGPNGIFSPPSDRSILNHAMKSDVVVVDYNEFDPAFDSVMAETIVKLEAQAAKLGRDVEILIIPRR